MLLGSAGYRELPLSRNGNLVFSIPTGMEDEAMRLGAIAYLRKPFDDQSLLDAIQLACEKAT